MTQHDFLVSKVLQPLWEFIGDFISLGAEIAEGDRLVLINGRKIRSKEKVIGTDWQNWYQNK